MTLIRKSIAKARKKKTNAYISSLMQKGLVIGDNAQIMEPFFLDPDHCFLISIGSNCTLAPNTRLIAHDASTKLHLGYTRIGRIIIEDNCFIGASTIVLPNVTIGKNTIIGAGSIVTKSIPSNSVAAGSPAKVISSLEAYLSRFKRMIKDNGTFDSSYLIDNISDSNKALMLKRLAGREGFIV